MRPSLPRLRFGSRGRFLLVAGCTCLGALTLPSARVLAQDITSPDVNASRMGDYRLQSGDVVRIQVFQEPDLDRDLPVSNAGVISGVPLLGAVAVRGLTIAQAEAEIARRYDADYLVDPQITVTVLRNAEQRVKVLGAVNAPGLVLVPPGERLTLIDAIARSGDFNRLADRRRVRVTRLSSSGESTNFIVDVDAVRAGGSAGVIWLERDDIVFVPERRI